MSEMFRNEQHSEMVDERQLRQPTVDMGTPVDLVNAAVRLDVGAGGVASGSNPPFLHPDDAVKTEIAELKSVDSMPHLMPMTSDTFPVEKKDADTEDWVPMVSQVFIATIFVVVTRVIFNFVRMMLQCIVLCVF